MFLYSYQFPRYSLSKCAQDFWNTLYIAEPNSDAKHMHTNALKPVNYTRNFQYTVNLI